MADLISKIKGLDNVTYDLQDKVSTFGNENLLGATNNYVLPATTMSAAFTFGQTAGYNSPISLFTLEEYDNSSNSLVLNNDTGTGNRGCSWCCKPGAIEAGETYTFTCWLKSSLATTAHMHTGWRNGSATAGYTGWTSQNNVSISANTWTEYRFTFQPSSSAKLDWEFLIGMCVTGNSSGLTCRFAHAKLEKGNKPTDWTTSCYDLATYASETITFFQ